jgi:hypothetical protein
MCDIGYIIKPHIGAIMQLLTDLLPDYGIHMITTKCLNTAVMMMYLFLGEAAKEPTKYCDTNVIRTRNGVQNSNATDRSIANALYDDVLSGTDHALFYVMITDSHIVHEADPTSKKYFPGHVFVIERIPPASPKERVRFNLYQSYINAYNMAGYIKKNNGLSMGRNLMEKHLNNLRLLAQSHVWTADTTKFWMGLTKVDSSAFQGHVIEGKLMLCYQKVVPEGCVVKLHELVDREVAKLRTFIAANPTKAKDVFGKRSLQVDKDAGAVPLTNAAMLARLRAIQRKLQ